MFDNDPLKYERMRTEAIWWFALQIRVTWIEIEGSDAVQKEIDALEVKIVQLKKLGKMLEPT